MKKQVVGILGASGYSGEVLVEILTQHTQVERLIVASRSHTGKRVDDILPRLAGIVNDLEFSSADPDELVAQAVDVWFLALPHGVAASYALKLVEAGSIVIDLSADFRLFSSGTYTKYYGAGHPAPDWLGKVPYVLPEYSSSDWQTKNLIACPGCYPTSVLLPLLPLVRDGIVPTKGIVINSMSGVTGAGKKEDLFYSYCERSESAQAYGIGKHRHLSEIEEQLEQVSGEVVHLQFTPHLIPLMRGIATTTVIPGRASLDAIYESWNKQYSGKPGVRILESGKAPETRPLTGRNRIDMSAYVDDRTGNVILTSAIDNLMKGASGQAVQIMNLRMNWPEFTGLT